MSVPLKQRSAIRMVSAVRRAFGGEERRRYTARHYLLSRAARALGFETYGANLAWLEDEDFMREWLTLPNYQDQAPDRKFVLRSLARSVSDLPGDTAECGTFQGSSSRIICLAMGGSNGRLHHAFDSFQGLSAPKEVDRATVKHAAGWESNSFAAPLDMVKGTLGDFSWVRYYPGWIPERFPDVADRRFAFVHVDVDLYDPTRDAIAFFYDRLVPGGMLVCDDYGFLTCPGAKRAFDEFVSGRAERIVHLPTGQGFITKR